MPVPLWQMTDAGPGYDVDLPGAALRVVHAVRAGAAPRMFPPVLEPGPDDTVIFARHLSGERDARMLARAFTLGRFAPLLDFLTGLDRLCETMAGRYASVVRPGVLAITNADLAGPLVAEVFVACATGDTEQASRFAAAELVRYGAFLTAFLERLRRDMGSVWPSEPRWRGPVTGLWAHGAETHNGRQRVLRLELAGGGTVAYKPRPALGEGLFLTSGETRSPGSVFDLLNGLPPALGRVLLPVFRCWTGDGQDRQFYSCRNGSNAPRNGGRCALTGQLSLRGTRLDSRQAARFWHRAGSLAAACFAFGISDLQEGNVLSGGDQPLMYPVDL